MRLGDMTIDQVVETCFRSDCCDDCPLVNTGICEEGMPSSWNLDTEVDVDA